jgi:hypothetical protein
MARFLQGWAIASALMLAATLASGFLTPTAIPREWHVLAGYVVTVSTLFSHTISILYFLTTGSAVRTAARQQAEQGNRSLVPLWEQTKKFKGTLFPILMLGMGAIMAGAIMGAGFLTGALPGWIHLSLELGAVPLNVFAILRTVSLIEQNIALISAAEALLSRAGS